MTIVENAVVIFYIYFYIFFYVYSQTMAEDNKVIFGYKFRKSKIKLMFSIVYLC